MLPDLIVCGLADRLWSSVQTRPMPCPPCHRGRLPHVTGSDQVVRCCWVYAQSLIRRYKTSARPAGSGKQKQGRPVLAMRPPLPIEGCADQTGKKWCITRNESAGSRETTEERIPTPTWRSPQHQLPRFALRRRRTIARPKRPTRPALSSAREAGSGIFGGSAHAKVISGASSQSFQSYKSTSK
jgi:hypothetical protein